MIVIWYDTVVHNSQEPGTDVETRWCILARSLVYCYGQPSGITHAIRRISCQLTVDPTSLFYLRVSHINNLILWLQNKFHDTLLFIIYTETACFAHGQLYVALSRVGSFGDVSVFIAHWKQTCVCIQTFEKDLLDVLSADTLLTTNVVYNGILTRDVLNDVAVTSCDDDSEDDQLHSYQYIYI